MHIVVRRRYALVGDVLLHLHSRQQTLDQGEWQLDLIGNSPPLCLPNIDQETIDHRLKQRFVDSRPS